MIIANALKRLFTGLTANTVLLGVSKPDTTIKYWYGDQKELLAWITNQNTRSTPEKYPLVWYVMGEYTEFQGWYTTDARLVIMQDTRVVELNDWRNSNSYEGILEPVWEVVKDKLTKHLFVDVVSSEKATEFKLRTIPNFGVDIDLGNTQTNDFTRKAQKSTQSISIDLVDCLVVDFKLRIKANCIN
jgi:hypothetical protein